MDNNFKKIRQIYFGIQDNTLDRIKIKNILFDPINEVKWPARWKVIALVGLPEAIGIFDLLKDKDLTVICETQEEYDSFTKLIDTILRLRKLSTEIDEYILTFVGGNLPDNSFLGYWEKISEYCKLRLLGHDEKNTESIVRTWNVTSDFEDCRRIYELLSKDQYLGGLLQKLVVLVNESSTILCEVRTLKAFEV